VQLPVELLNSLNTVEGFDKQAFINIHTQANPPVSVRSNPNKRISQYHNIPISDQIPWTENGFYLKERPSFTFDPIFHAGCYYVQEASSMFLEQALKQTIDLSKPLKVLDLCAAPGGKSTHIQSLISKESLLVSNEVIKSRCNILKDNIIKWGCENVVVTNNDPKDFSRLENYFDVIVVDAPCSGSGLFRKEPDAIEHWSENNVMLCSQRQQRILADVWPALKKDGVLIYSTCSYSKQEDEDIVEWVTNTLSIENCLLTIDNDSRIIKTQNGLRFWPDKIKGEGFFIAAFRKKDGDEFVQKKLSKKLNEISANEVEIVKPWCKVDNDSGFVNGFDGIYTFNKNKLADINLLHTSLRVAYFGVRVGDIMKNKLVPAHALAMSNLIGDSVPRINLDFEQAIRYLQKKDIAVEKSERGWQLICFQNHPIGWVKLMPGRLNNYYPMELRILKDK
jgi:NOL1/NOP2/sun family putative RNA methylase